MTDSIIPCVISLTPLVTTVIAWVQVWRTRKLAVHPFGLVLLGMVTLLAAVAAGEFVYFSYKPVHLPPWQSPQIALLGWFFLLGPASMLLCFLAYNRFPKWLFWVTEFTSLWLFGLGVLAGMAY